MLERRKNSNWSAAPKDFVNHDKKLTVYDCLNETTISEFKVLSRDSAFNIPYKMQMCMFF